MTSRVTGSRVAAIAVTLLVAAGMTFLSRRPVTAHGSTDAMLRLAWTARPERIERCRTLTAEELAALPAHMRQEVVCEGVTARYRVEVYRDGTLLATDELRGGGLRNDRQLYHYRELPVPSGPSTFEVRVTRTDTLGRPVTGPARRATDDVDDTERDDDGREVDAEDDEDDGMSPASDLARRGDEERRRRRADEIPPALVLTETVTLAPREVVLVKYDRTARRLRAERRDQ